MSEEAIRLGVVGCGWFGLLALHRAQALQALRAGELIAIAARHYAMSIDLDADFRRADERASSTEAQQKAEQSESASEEQPATVEPAQAQPTLENKENVVVGELCASGSTKNDWAILDLNQ